jgi:hypothetical protein
MALKKSHKPVRETMVEEPAQDLKIPLEFVREEE